MKRSTELGERFAGLVRIMAQLRSESGCPWDKEQTHGSLKPFLVEEAYEFLEAVDGEDPKAMTEELGDLLLQILFHCQIASELGRFDAADVLTGLREKLRRRHPHVFSDARLPDARSVLQHWVKAKTQEKQLKKGSFILGKLPKGMPALIRAQRLGERASHLGFDWSETEQVWLKVEEEMGELRAALASGRQERARAELGDVLFALVSLARFLNFEAEDALTQSLNRFVARFEHLEKEARQRGTTVAQCSAAELEVLWRTAKKMTARPEGTKSRPGPDRTKPRKRTVRRGRAKP